MPIHSKRKQMFQKKNGKVSSIARIRIFQRKRRYKLQVTRQRINKQTNILTPRPSYTDKSQWELLDLPPELLLALKEMKFYSPTPIQRLSIPPAAKLHHVIGAAETGSGKTLAFGLAVLTQLLRSDPNASGIEKREREEGNVGCVGWVDDIPNEEFDRMLADPTLTFPFLSTSSNTLPTCKRLQVLILTPTRELCLQVCSHLRAAAVHTSIHVVSLVGGMAISKQTRLLARRPEIVVSTPGRYLQLLEEQHQYCQELDHLSHLVIDEVDRMLSEGHFASIGLIFDKIPVLSGDTRSEGPQVLLFSATVPSHFLNLKKHERDEPEGVRKLKRYISRRKTDVINLTRRNVLVEQLTEYRLMVESGKKLYYLYYLLRKREKVLVFSNSIAALRQLYGQLTTLNLSVLVVHSGMQQKQRLSNLEKFNSSGQGILLASDMTSRGIDFRDVSDVIHYHVPATAQLYVHRCGRTARTSHKGGSSLLLIAPEEIKRYNTICTDLKKTAGIPTADISINEVRSYYHNRTNLCYIISRVLKHLINSPKITTFWTIFCRAKILSIIILIQIILTHHIINVYLAMLRK